MAADAFDALIIGGGPAGLSATLYLARYNRRVALFDTGQGRSTWHQVNHNYLGFPGGIAARRLRELGRAQVQEYGQVALCEHHIDGIQRDGELFIATGQAGAWQGRSVILCTGVVDHYPHFPDWHEYVGRSMFWCITCDGYACIGARVVVAGNTDHTATEALQLTRFTDQLTVLTDSHESHLSPECARRLARAGIPVVQDRIASVDGADGKLEWLHTTGGQSIALDLLFVQQGATPQSALARELDARVNAAGYIMVDSEQKTSVAGG